MNILDVISSGSIGGAPSIEQINKQGDRIAGLLRQSVQNVQPTIGDRFDALTRMNVEAANRSAQRAAGVIPTTSLNQTYDARLDTLVNDRRQRAQDTISAEQNVFNIMQNARARGNEEANRLLDMAERVAGEDAMDLINGMNADIGEEINPANFMALALPYAKQKGILKTGEYKRKRQELELANLRSQISTREQGLAQRRAADVAKQQQNAMFQSLLQSYMAGGAEGASSANAPIDSEQLSMIGIATGDPRYEALAGIERGRREKQVTRQKRESGLRRTAGELDASREMVKELINHPGLDDAVGMKLNRPEYLFGIKEMPLEGTEAASFVAKLDTLKGRLGFDKLQALRDASPTGGALGQVTERELAFLQNSVAALSTAQNESQFVGELQKIDNFLSGSKDRLVEAAIADGLNPDDVLASLDQDTPAQLPSATQRRRYNPDTGRLE